MREPIIEPLGADVCPPFIILNEIDLVLQSRERLLDFFHVALRRVVLELEENNMTIGSVFSELDSGHEQKGSEEGSEEFHSRSLNDEMARFKP
ncbi:hypothetical protein N9060_02365 [Arenicella sp.]|nr:hypothetical protein [Arenicella sp.]